MKPFLFAAVGLLGSAGVAAAADYSYHPMGLPHAAPKSIWQGTYFGANVGYATGKIHGEIPGVLRGSINARGVLGGVHAGYNVISDSMLYGVETDFQIASISGRWEPVAGAGLRGRMSWLSTLRGRIGFASPSWLLYGTGGLAIGGGKATAFIPGVSASSSKTHVGWTLGVGTEYAINHEISVRLEYLYADFGKKSYTSNASASMRTHMFRVGATAHF